MEPIATPTDGHLLPGDLRASATGGVAEVLGAWMDGEAIAPGPDAGRSIADALGLTAADGFWLCLRLPGRAPVSLGAGRFADGAEPPPGAPGGVRLPLAADRLAGAAGEAWLPGDATRAVMLRSRLELGLELALAHAEARRATTRLEALDAATAAIAAELSVERVLQVIVDRVRPLVAARYAALGIVDQRGRMERFVVSGMDDAERRAIGHLPRGLGILGVIIRDGRSVRLDDLMTDPRAHGFPEHHPAMHGFLGVPVTAEGRTVGNLYLTEKAEGAPFTADDQRLVETFARHAGIAMNNARLHQELGRLAVLQERERIGQDLHDGIIQALYAVSLGLEDVADTATDDPADAAARIELAIDGIHGAIRDIRNFIFGLRPELLGDVDLGSAIAALADEFRRSASLDLELRIGSLPDVDAEVAIQLVQMTREALSNIARHSGAARAAVELSEEGGILTLAIEDDGRGFDPDADPGPAHRGLANMRARADSFGGAIAIDTGRGTGTRIVVRLPVGPASMEERR